MRSILAFGVAATLLATSAHAASSADGLWRTPSKHGVVEVYDCEAALCARVVTSDTLKANPDLRDVHNADPSLRSRSMKGVVVISAMTGGPTEWKGGRAYDPDDGKTYSGSLRLTDPDTLTMKGCVVAPFCLSQTWRRAK